MRVNNSGGTNLVGRDAATAATFTPLTIDHDTTGTPAAAFGTVFLIAGTSSTTVTQSMADITATWVVATHASRTARTIFNVYDTAAREAIRIEASGSAPMIGFLGAAAIVRITTGVAGAAFTANSGTSVNDASTFGGYTLKQIAQALVNYGLLT